MRTSLPGILGMSSQLQSLEELVFARISRKTEWEPRNRTTVLPRRVLVTGGGQFVPQQFAATASAYGLLAWA